MLAAILRRLFTRYKHLGRESTVRLPAYYIYVHAVVTTAKTFTTLPSDDIVKFHAAERSTLNHARAHVTCNFSRQFNWRFYVWWCNGRSAIAWKLSLKRQTAGTGRESQAIGLLLSRSPKVLLEMKLTRALKKNIEPDVGTQYWLLNIGRT